MLEYFDSVFVGRYGRMNELAVSQDRDRKKMEEVRSSRYTLYGIDEAQQTTSLVLEEGGA